MTTITATLQTPSASKYLQQLCKHFEHKIPAAWDDKCGNLKFEAGSCDLAAAGDTLTMTCHGEGDENLQRLIFVVEAHLARFAWREEIDLDWFDETGSSVTKSDEIVAKLTPIREKHADKRSSA